MPGRPRSGGQWALGALSLWPLTYICGCTTSLADALAFAAGRPPSLGPSGWGYLGPVIALHLSSSLVLLFVVVACLVHLASNEGISEGLRIPLFLLLVMVAPVAAPAYWWSEMGLSPAERARRLRP